MIFKDRFEAGRLLAEKLQEYKEREDVIILAIPRGALQIGAVLSKELLLPLDVVLTKKIGYPGNPEYAIGSVSLSDYVVDEQLITSGKVSQDYVDEQVKEIQMKLKERYGGHGRIGLENKTAIIVDDGIATGRTMLAAIELVKKEGAKKVVVAIPVAPPDAIKELETQADEVICLNIESDFMAIGQFYEDFEPVEDEEAIRLLKAAK